MTKTGETTQVRANATLESGSVRERPILFSSSMVRAILDGKKTQTRRTLNLDPFTMDALDHRGIGHLKLGIGGYGGMSYYDANGGCTSFPLRCPYGQSGDRLWVRETWAPADAMAGIHDTDLDTPQCVAYAADRTAVVFGHDLKARKADTYAWNWDRLKWRPSIFMPRWASRITLEVTGVRVERLHDISGRDVLAEGVDNGKSNPAQGERWENMQRIAFETLWDSINGKRAPWASNPWLWVVEFRRVEAA